VFAQDSSVLFKLPNTEKIRLIDRLMSGYVSERDLAASETLCGVVATAADLKAIRDAISHWVAHLNTAQGGRLRTALNRL
jgi:hypothetical protein